MQSSKYFNIKVVTGKKIEPFLSDIARLRISVFKEFPYLYDGDENYEQSYLQTYTRSDNSIAILVFNKTLLVGVSTGIPLAHETIEFQRPFTEKGMNPSDIFYCGESILDPEYRGMGIYKTFVNRREEHARHNKFRKICFCAVARPENHPLKPDNYQPLDRVWKSFGYEKRPDLTTLYTWKDIDQDEEDEKTMIFWIKDL